MVYDCFFSLEEFIEIKNTAELHTEDHTGSCLSTLIRYAGYDVNPEVDGPDGPVYYEDYLSATPDEEIVSELEKALAKADF
tara:strand:- start:1407 stop:1649 length:243 start_codon:yes stop_codon:yes gene_type:complete